MAENVLNHAGGQPFGRILWPCDPGLVIFLFVNLYIESNLIRRELVSGADSKAESGEDDSAESDPPVIEAIASQYLLTEREKEIFQQVTMGCGNADIAANLCISVYTVKRHLNNIFKKMNVKSRFELINMMIKH